VSRRPYLVAAATGLTAALAAAAFSPTGAEDAKPVAAPAQTAVATFASGCFWCTESDFEKVPGVVEAISGYTGGTTPNPTYRQVSTGGTGHTEAVQVRYDPAVVTYERLLDVYWRNVDPVDAGGQFCDRGDQYRSAIFVHDGKQRQAALESKAAIERSGRLSQPIVTPVVQAETFYPAEDYHQDYAKKNPLRYTYYRNGCGRDQRLEELWKGTS
jgi:peptide-methionine (S)-S-oxide reductase